MKDIKKLREVAHKAAVATSASWVVHIPGVKSANFGIDYRVSGEPTQVAVWWGSGMCGIPSMEVAQHIEAFDPGTVNELLTELESLRNELRYKFKFETLVDHCKRQDQEIAELRAQVNHFKAYSHDHVWHWQHDGHDHPESIVCPVVIDPDHLREIIANGDQLKFDELREIIAQAIYYEWRDSPKWTEWQPGGNSMKQDQARRIADDHLRKLLVDTLS